MVLCQENANMFQSRHSPPTSGYNFGHFSGYMPQTTQYPAPTGQSHDYGQYQMDPGAFQQAPCYMTYGSRPVEDWANSYGMPTTTGTVSPHSYSYRPAPPMGVDYTQQPLPQGNGINQNLSALGSSPQPVCSPTASTSSSGSPGSPSNKQLRPPYDWMKKTSYAPSGPIPGKTRTKDKYRVVYSDHQRLELEKEFHYSRYITIRRKAELAQNLALSERQVKIWFQNRRAKERKQNKKREDLNSSNPEMNIHADNSGVAQQMSLSVHNNQPIIKQDPMEDYGHQMSPQMQDHKEGIIQSHHSPEFHQTPSPVTSSINPIMQSATPISVIKMDPQELVSQA
ncbi:homeobox protein CDX-1-like [Saccostrea echinata]|uniref:homeobox protein CDX-1-like n=1 Tax=Saccostrea echinata TaxID=191078 RepID=UPI002A8313BE|nr:homeobox protein CDX-1-like [Saccostrea echinata]